MANKIKCITCGDIHTVQPNVLQLICDCTLKGKDACTFIVIRGQLTQLGHRAFTFKPCTAKSQIPKGGIKLYDAQTSTYVVGTPIQTVVQYVQADDLVMSSN